MNIFYTKLLIIIKTVLVLIHSHIPKHCFQNVWAGIFAPQSKKAVYLSQHIERDQLSPNIKIDSLLFPKWLFFHLNSGAKIFEMGLCVLEIW